MDQSKTPVLLVALFGLLAVFVTVASIMILSGGKVYHKIPEKSRPRRWLVGIFFSYFVVFCLWFATWFFYPHSTTAHATSFLFGASTVFIVAWYALGRVRDILLPIIALIARIKDGHSDGSGQARPKSSRP
jgi:hypothetical protein